MTLLAQATDVDDALGRSLTSDETSRATSLLALASREVEAQTNYRFAPGSYTVGREVRTWKVKIPAAASSIVNAVRNLNPRTGEATNLTTPDNYTTHGAYIYLLTGYTGYNRESAFAEINYLRTHMYRPFIEIDFTVTTPVPDEVINLVAGIVSCTISGPPIGVSSEHSGPSGVSYVNASGKVWLSVSDKQILNRYKQAKPAIDLTAGMGSNVHSW